MSAESNSERSVSYQKKDGRCHAHPSFFWYDNDKDLKVCFLVTHAINAWLFSEWFIFQELNLAKNAVITFCFYAVTVTLPHVCYGFMTSHGTSRFQIIISLAWIGVALQPLVFFATNRKYRKYTIALVCCRRWEYSIESGKRTTASHLPGSKLSKNSVADTDNSVQVLPSNVKDKSKSKIEYQCKENLKPIVEESW